MQSFSTVDLIRKRLAENRFLMYSIFASITVAVTLVAAAPVYLQALERLALNLAIDGLSQSRANITAFAFNIPLIDAELDRADQQVDGAIDEQLDPIHGWHESYYMVDNYLAGIPRNPLPGPNGPSYPTSRAYFRHLTNLEKHITFLGGRMATDKIVDAPQGPIVEAIVSENTAEVFGLHAGDLITTVPDLRLDSKVRARITGVFAPTDVTEEYWGASISILIDPIPPEEPPEGVTLPYNPEEPPVPVFITREAMVQAVGGTYPGSLITTIWFISVDTEALKTLSVNEVREALGGFDSEFARSVPQAQVFTGVDDLLDVFENRAFFSKIPMLLLLAIMLVMILFYMGMMVSYLVHSREGDMALLRTRGVGTVELLRLYALEGGAITAIAVLIAPFLAMGLVALAGVLPYFDGMTKGSPLPVEFAITPFVVAAATGLLCLAVFVIPTVIGARGGLLAHKLRSSRPPMLPLFHRYYLDIALVIVGGLTFWELRSRGHLVSGGLFEGIQVNETMLLAPVLFLVAVALVFMRLFPLFVRLISGESRTLIHVFAAATVIPLALGIAITELPEVAGDWILPSAIVLTAGGVYWATASATTGLRRLAGLITQGLLVAWFVAVYPMDPEDILFLLVLSLVALVPVQVLFGVLRAAMKLAPVWLSIGLWRMARNPLQYTWLILLLVMATGVGVLSTTVGGTLELSQQERVLYDVGADYRISDLSTPSIPGGIQELRKTYLTIPGVTSASMAFRDTGSLGAVSTQILALESDVFPYMAWFRDDFSNTSLAGLMGALQLHPQVAPIEIPESATQIGLWIRPEEIYTRIRLYIVVEDSVGATQIVFMGELDQDEWHLKRGVLPSNMQPPLQLVSVQIFESGFGPTGTPGSFALDDIHVVLGSSGEEVILEDFERQMRWSPIITSPFLADRISVSFGNAHDGQSGVYTFGRDNINGIRGIYQNPTGGPMPIIASSQLMDTLGMDVGDSFILDIRARQIPVVIRGEAGYFPTVSPEGGNFLIADLDDVLGHLNILSAAAWVRPNELFLSGSSAAHQSVRSTINSFVLSSRQFHDRQGQLDAAKRDPLATAGWRAMVLVSLGIVLLTTAFGYVTYLLLFSSRTRSEMGFLQSMGLSRRQLVGLVGFEHAAIAIAGMSIGTWAGFEMSRLMVSPLAVTETGREVVPPFVLITDWSLMAPTYVGLVGVFVAALYLLNRSIRRLDLQTLARSETG